MPIRGVRGATTAKADTREAILAAVRELLEALTGANELQTEDLASALFTSTPDLTATFPAEAAHDLGWEDVPLLGAVEQAVAKAPERCIRVLLHWNTDRRQDEVRHVYLHGAQVLRPDRAAAR